MYDVRSVLFLCLLFSIICSDYELTVCRICLWPTNSWFATIINAHSCVVNSIEKRNKNQRCIATVYCGHDSASDETRIFFSENATNISGSAVRNMEKERVMIKLPRSNGSTPKLHSEDRGAPAQ